MKYFFTTILLAFGMLLNAQTWTPIYSNQKIDGVWANKYLIFPTDTSTNKTGVVMVANKFWIGNGTKWTTISSDTGRGASQLVTGGSFKKVVDSSFTADSLQKVTARGNRANDSLRANKYIVEVGGVRFSSFHSDYQTNTFAGLSSGLSNTPIATTQGRQNTFYGALSGRNNTTGYATDNFGYSAGIGQTTGGPNVNIGYQSAYKCDTCKYNVNLGTDAGYNNKVNNQIFIGFHAGKSVNNANEITGERNIVLSVEGGTNLTTGYENVIAGDRAGWSVTTGHRNSMIGVSSGFYTTTGYRNAFFGGQAGFSNIGGYENTYSGYRAGYSGTSANSNTAKGAYSLFSNIDGYGHVAIGYQAGFSITGGGNSTYIGTNAGYNASQKVDPFFSIALGHSAYNTKNYQAVIGSIDIGETLLRGKVLVNTETNNGVDALQVNGSITATNLLSGTYTPTATASTNVTSVTTYPLRYTRVGNVVNVTGMIEPVVTTANTQSKYFLSLPISPTANFSQIYYATVTGSIGSSTASTIPIYGVGESGGIRVEINFTATSTGSSNQVINISYTIAN
jgi:hypothetical protein